MSFSKEQEVAKAIKRGLMLAPIGVIILFIFVFATGSTFGQRCSKIYEAKSVEWKLCVNRLSKGGELVEK